MVRRKIILHTTTITTKEAFQDTISKKGENIVIDNW